MIEKTQTGLIEHHRAGQTTFIPRSKVPAWCNKRGYNLEYIKKQPLGIIK